MWKNRIKGPLCLIFIIIFIVSFTVAASASARATDYGTLSCWYSDSDAIGRFNYAPGIYSEKINTNGSFPLTLAVNQARSQWNSALGISMQTTSASAAGITIYGGTYQELVVLGIMPSLDSTDNGVTDYPGHRSNVGTYTYNTVQKEACVHTISLVVVVDKGNTTAQVYKTTTHEMGHALGWHGHDAYNTSGVMYATGHSTYTLSYRDKDHLSQRYE